MALAQLSHPNVVTIYDVGSADNQTFIAMELAAGGTLGDWLDAAPRTPKETFQMFLHAGRGLAAAHEAGLVHRDFKPTNVLVGNDGRPRVGDFGLARSSGDFGLSTASPTETAHMLHSITTTGCVMGTPAYMAPEQHRGGLLDERSDQFSFCVALFEGLYGYRPYIGNDLDELLQSKVSGPQVPLSDTDIPAAVLHVLRQGLDPRPERRFPTMNALLQALESAWRSDVKDKFRWSARTAYVAIATTLAAAAIAWTALDHDAAAGENVAVEQPRVVPSARADGESNAAAAGLSAMSPETAPVSPRAVDGDSPATPPTSTDTPHAVDTSSPRKASKRRTKRSQRKHRKARSGSAPASSKASPDPNGFDPF
jgi:serine/threonine protein kinase